MKDETVTYALACHIAVSLVHSTESASTVDAALGYRALVRVEIQFEYPQLFLAVRVPDKLTFLPHEPQFLGSYVVLVHEPAQQFDVVPLHYFLNH